MKSYQDTIKKKGVRFIAAVAWQLLWLIPLGIAGWYAHTHMTAWCDSYFGVNQARAFAERLTRQSAELGNPVVWNPGTMAVFAKVSLFSMTATAKAYSLAALSGLIAGIGNLILYTAGILAVFRAFSKTRQFYHNRTQEKTISNAICREVIPILTDLKQEIEALKQELSQARKSE
ncbi:MAG: hypothetical protein IJV07_02265 [Alphaproteobacteria bacterium]|nr:hypothetical protein [Alphaproteobacteria bacterium]